MDNLWDDVWKNRNTISDYSLQYGWFMSNFAKCLPKKGKVLEAGCGSGDTLALFKDQETYGFDLSKKSLELAKKNADKTVLGDIMKMPLKDNTFDLVYNSGVLEHFKEPTNLVAAKEMARITKVGGYVVIVLPNKYCLWYQLYKWFTTKITGTWEFGYEECYSSARLKNLVRRAGLQVVETFGLQVLPPLATNRSEAVSLKIRKKVMKLNKLFPSSALYAYGTGVVCKKV
tara:strand:- start:2345 stop:3034 length:690 start_codon:yes stop_codon:yes gene_type:complete